jgi:predicted DNA-binding transcriptional regulator AlpA
VSGREWRDTLRALDVPGEETALAIGELEVLKADLLALLVKPEDLAPQENRLLTPEQVAGRLQVDKGWVYRHSGELGGIKLSHKMLRFPVDAVDAYIRRRRAASSNGRRK